jgi:hypothetical protein
MVSTATFARRQRLLRALNSRVNPADPRPSGGTLGALAGMKIFQQDSGGSFRLIFFLIMRRFRSLEGCGFVEERVLLR